MKPADIDKLIGSLETEIKKTVDVNDQEEALMRLQHIAKSYKGDDQVVSSLDIAKEIKTRPEQNKLMTGIEGLDNILDGFREQQLIVISGITKHGKTSFAIDLTSRMSETHPAWLPFEESAEELIIKFQDRGEDPPLFYTPRQLTTNTLDWIEQKMIETKAKFDSKIVFIDHLGFIIPRSDNEAQEIGRVMRGLKDLAKKWKLVVVLLAHLTKTQLDRHPNLEDLRGSAAIGQEADTVIFVWRKTTKDFKTGEVTISNETNVSVQANRRSGKTGNVKLVYSNGHYLEQDWKHEEGPYGGHYKPVGGKDDWGEFDDRKRLRFE